MEKEKAADMAARATDPGHQWQPDYDQVKSLCLLGATVEELAWALGIHRSTLWRHMQTDAILRAIVEDTTTAGRTLSLKRMQWQAATKGDRALLIWLGKQELHQREPGTHKAQAIEAAYQVEEVHAAALAQVAQFIETAQAEGKSLADVLRVIEANRARLLAATSSSDQAPTAGASDDGTTT